MQTKNIYFTGLCSAMFILRTFGRVKRHQNLTVLLRKSKSERKTTGKHQEQTHYSHGTLHVKKYWRRTLAPDILLHFDASNTYIRSRK